MNPFYTDYAEYLSRLFPGIKVQKLSINGGMTCPNRDGTISTGGCIYCDNRSFSPEYTSGAASISEQLRAGREFFGRKYPEMKYLAYFQSYTNTHAPTERLCAIYEEAIAQPDVVGLIIGTRPDCLPEATLDLLGALASRTTVMVELGAESAHDRTLLRINRGHTWGQTVSAVQSLHERGIHVGLHLIAGLPGESRADILESVDACCLLPIDTLKLHQMQVIAGTELHRRFLEGTADITLWQPEEYADLCTEIVTRVPRRIAIERFVSQAPPGMLIAPKWGLKNYQFANLLTQHLNTK